MTGPPGFYRNGGLFRWLKIFMLRVEKDPVFLSQVLHFLDFGIRKKNLDLWLSRPVLEWIRETDPEIQPTIMLDSGGFQFLHDANDCLKSYLSRDMGIHVDEGGVYDIQRRIGGDIIISFDYPLDQRLGRREAWERCKRSIDIGVETLRRLSLDDHRPLLLLAVHGLDREMAARYTKELFRRIGSMGESVPPFGLAIGSLVPLALPGSKNYLKILEIVSAVMQGIPEAYKGIPVHALGMSGPIVPFLVYLGVNSFDGSSFIVGANNLAYVTAGKKKKMYNVAKADLEACDCEYCRLMGRIGIRNVHAVLQGSGKGTIPELMAFDPMDHSGRMDGKSSVYGLLAMHNLSCVKRSFREYARSGLHNGDPRFLFHACENAEKDLAEPLAWLASKDRKVESAQGKSFLVPPPAPLPLPRAPEKGTISLSMGSDSFDLGRKRYKPSGSIALVLPCTPQKPYSESRTHRRIMEAIKEAFPKKHSCIEKITLSGLYGPVPEKYETVKAVLQYDYRLRTYDIFKPQRELVEKRLLAFLDRHQKRFEKIILYASKKPYREIMENAHRRFSRTFLFPEKAGKDDIASEKLISQLIKRLHLCL